MKRKKNTRMHGSHTHGGGSKKKRRGAGHRGGRGRAGSGKRADAKKPSYWKERTGGLGFTSQATKDRIVTLEYLEHSLDALVRNGKAETKDGVIHINLSLLKYNKLLSKGTFTKKIEVHVEKASQRAQEKVTAAGGKVILPQTDVDMD